jgi:hypothetical protein
MSTCDGITDGTKMCGSERVGNYFVLLCVMHTHIGKELMSNKMKKREIPIKRVIKCLKLYLAYERGLLNHIPGHRYAALIRFLVNLLK